MSNIIKSIECPVEEFAKGTIIFKEGEPSRVFFIIKSGAIDVYKNFESPTPLKLATIPEGRVLGEISCLDGGVRTATAVASSDVVLVKIAAETLKWQMDQCPRWFGAVIMDIVERLRATDELLPLEQQALYNNTGSEHHLKDMTSMKKTHEES